MVGAVEPCIYKFAEVLIRLGVTHMQYTEIRAAFGDPVKRGRRAWSGLNIENGRIRRWHLR